jgi:hypothetical protein
VKKFNRLGLYIPWVAFVTLVTGWCVYWHVLKDKAVEALDGAIAQVRDAGGDAGYEKLRTRGFPTHLTLVLETVWLESGGARFEVKKLPVSINMVSPRHLIIDLQDGVRHRPKDGNWRALSMRHGAMSIRFTRTQLARLSLDMEAPILRREDTDTAFSTTRLLAHLRPDPRAAGDLQLALEIEGASFPEPVAGLAALGTQIQHLKALVVLENAAAGMAARSLSGWKKRGGLRFEGLEAGWGALSATGTGALTFDKAGRPQGVLHLQPSEGKALDLIADNGAWRLEPTSADPGPSSAAANPAPHR